jgi:hypothetical protein
VTTTTTFTTTAFTTTTPKVTPNGDKSELNVKGTLSQKKTAQALYTSSPSLIVTGDSSDCDDAYCSWWFCECT